MLLESNERERWQPGRNNLYGWVLIGRWRVLDAIKRIAVAEAAASNAPREPELRLLNNFSILSSDPEATGRTVGALGRHFGDDKIYALPRRDREAANGLRSRISWMF